MICLHCKPKLLILHSNGKLRGSVTTVSNPTEFHKPLENRKHVSSFSPTTYSTQLPNLTDGTHGAWTKMSIQSFPVSELQ